MDAKLMRTELLEKFLDVASLRHRVIAQNVANVNTPGFHQMDVSFEDHFARQLRQGTLESAMRVKPVVGEGAGGAERADGNNVDIDVEMTRLAKNTLLYRAFTQIIASEISARQSAITGQ